MKKIVFIFSFLFASFFGFAQTFDTVLLLYNGPSDKRINLVILGDGYDITEQDTFITDATQLTNYRFSKLSSSNLYSKHL